MPRASAGILLFRTPRVGEPEVLLVHPGGPFWARKDEGAWSIPKGELDENERPWEAARREFQEELGSPPPEGQPLDLGQVRQKGGKTVHCLALNGDFSITSLKSNVVAMQWPPKTGRLQSFPEVDRAEWFTLSVAKTKLNAAQSIFINRLRAELEAL